MRVVLAPFIFVIHTTLQISNLAFWGMLIITFGLVKLVLPFEGIKALFSSLMNGMLCGFGKVSVSMIQLFNPVDIEYRIDGELDKDNWYLIVANHLSYLDIVLMIEFAADRIPAPKFFLKKELIWLPFVGLGAWALDMPFMRRYSQAYIAKHPDKKGMDIATTKKYCEKFKTQPTTVINFVEGTRFTPQKHAQKGGEFTHLLPPKAGGIAFTLATMGDLFTNILDVSLMYPENRRHPMVEMLSGCMKKIVIDVKVLEVPAEAQGDYFEDESFRQRFQAWLNRLWTEKDQRINKLLGM